jgi:hypothetical protein
MEPFAGFTAWKINDLDFRVEEAVQTFEQLSYLYKLLYCINDDMRFT